MTATDKQVAGKPIITFMNSDVGRALRSTVGSALLLKGGNILVKGVGAVLVASGPLDFCPTNLVFGYSLPGAQAREELKAIKD